MRWGHKGSEASGCERAAAGMPVLGVMMGVFENAPEKVKLQLTESLTRMNWPTSITGGALKLRAEGATTAAAAGMVGVIATGTGCSGMALFFGGRGMVEAGSGEKDFSWC